MEHFRPHSGSDILKLPKISKFITRISKKFKRAIHTIPPVVEHEELHPPQHEENQETEEINDDWDAIQIDRSHIPDKSVAKQISYQFANISYDIDLYSFAFDYVRAPYRTRETERIPARPNVEVHRSEVPEPDDELGAECTAFKLDLTSDDFKDNTRIYTKAGRFCKPLGQLFNRPYDYCNVRISNFQFGISTHISNDPDREPTLVYYSKKRRVTEFYAKQTRKLGNNFICLVPHYETGGNHYYNLVTLPEYSTLNIAIKAMNAQGFDVFAGRLSRFQNDPLALFFNIEFAREELRDRINNITDCTSCRPTPYLLDSDTAVYEYLIDCFMFHFWNATQLLTSGLATTSSTSTQSLPVQKSYRFNRFIPGQKSEMAYRSKMTTGYIPAHTI